MTPLAYRWQNLMKPGYVDGFSKNELYEDSYRQCMEKGMKAIGYEEKVKAYANQTGPIRRGIGLATFWYNTAVFPISLETSSCRLQLNLDGTVNLQVGETEIGQGADTAYAQMCAEILGLSDYKKVHVLSCQDTDVTPTGLGAYASRQTFTAGFSIRQTSELLKRKILEYACELTRQATYNMDIIDSNIVRITDGRVLMSLSELSMTAQYNPVHSEHLTAESTYTIRNNAYSFVKASSEAEYSDSVMAEIDKKAAESGKTGSGSSGSTAAETDGSDGDEMLPAAVDVILETGQASVSMLQRRLKLGYARAARIMDEMEERGIVGPFEGSKPRQLLITREQWQAIKDGAPISSEPVEEEIP